MAHGAFLSFSPLMYSKMFIQISFLSKWLITIRFLTFERSFTSVNSEMVKKIMPLSKIHFTSIMIAFKDFDISLSAWVLIFINTEFSSGWNLFLNFNRGKVKLITSLYCYLSTFWNFFTNFSVRDVSATNYLTSYRLPWFFRRGSLLSFLIFFLVIIGSLSPF